MSNSKVQAVLVIIVGVIHTHMAQGKSVHITGLGYFRYTLDTASVDSLEAFDFDKQVKTVRVEFIPERTKLANGTYTRALVAATNWNGSSFRPTRRTVTRRRITMRG